VVLFDKFIEEWSFLTIHWCRWSLLSKILIDKGASGSGSYAAPLLQAHLFAYAGAYDFDYIFTGLCGLARRLPQDERIKLRMTRFKKKN
jgi:hypothetical protein